MRASTDTKTMIPSKVNGNMTKNAQDSIPIMTGVHFRVNLVKVKCHMES